MRARVIKFATASTFGLYPTKLPAQVVQVANWSQHGRVVNVGAVKSNQKRLPASAFVATSVIPRIKSTKHLNGCLETETARHRLPLPRQAPGDPFLAAAIVSD
jgi:hypothetical protein